jgi:hypothetical protein
MAPGSGAPPGSLPLPPPSRGRRERASAISIALHLRTPASNHYGDRAAHHCAASPHTARGNSRLPTAARFFCGREFPGSAGRDLRSRGGNICAPLCRNTRCRGGFGGFPALFCDVPVTGRAARFCQSGHRCLRARLFSHLFTVLLAFHAFFWRHSRNDGARAFSGGPRRQLSRKFSASLAHVRLFAFWRNALAWFRLGSLG